MPRSSRDLLIGPCCPRKSSGWDLPRRPAFTLQDTGSAATFPLNGADYRLRFIGVLAKPEFLRRFAVDDSSYSELP